MKGTFSRSRIAVYFLFLFTLALFEAGCSTTESPIDEDIDTEPPRVVHVTAIDWNHIEVEFNEELYKPTAERRKNYTVVEGLEPPVLEISPNDASGQSSTGSVLQPDTLDINTAILKEDSKTVLLTTWDYMGQFVYDIYVSGVKDAHGNSMTGTQSMGFAGSITPDHTPPEIISRSPGPAETGVGLSQSVEVQFSEGMNYTSVFSAFSWTWSGGSVSFMMNRTDNNTYIFTPVQGLNLNTIYTTGFTAGTAKDWVDNYLAPSSWTFRTTSTADLIAPTIVSTYPQDGATNVPLGANLVITFSEPIDPNSGDEFGIMITPNPGEGIPSWSNGNRKITFDPDSPLLANTMYIILVPPGAVTDLSGNPLEEATKITFTTGSALPTGAFSGTIAGDPNSLGASNPAGTIVVAFLISMEEFEYIEGPPPFGGSDIAGATGNYTVPNLEDEVYYPLGILDSNRDGILDPEKGDAMGVYGVDIGSFDFTVDSVTISGGGSVINVDFPLFDPVAIQGTVTYGGTAHIDSLVYFEYFIGAFDTATFDTSMGFPDPDFDVGPYWIAEEPEYLLSQFEEDLEPGTYYVGGFLDVNMNYDYDPAIDPAGFYMSGSNFAPITVENGTDELDIDIVFMDPGSGSLLSTSRWTMDSRRSKNSSERHRLYQHVRGVLKKTMTQLRGVQ